MQDNLDKLNHNEVVFLDRVELNNLAVNLSKRDERKKLVEKVLTRTELAEKRNNKPCMNVPVRVWELKIIYPDFKLNPPKWWKRRKI